MPDVRDFLLQVLPWPGDNDPGYCNVHVQMKIDNKTIWVGRPFKTVDRFLEHVHSVLSWKSVPDIYYCLSLQKDHSEKTDKWGNYRAVKRAENAIALKAIWLDIDVGKKDGYATLKDAAQDLVRFRRVGNLPVPSAAVHSGGGLHIYWINNHPLSINEWRQYALGLKALAQSHKFNCDLNVVADAARVLRIPGTFNMKTNIPRPVRLLTLEKDYDFAVDLKHLPGLVPAGSVTSHSNRWFEGDLPSSPPDWALSEETESLSAGIEMGWRTRDLESAKSECEFIREALDTGGKEFDNPLWNLTTLISVFTEGGNSNAHKMADGHPEYTQATTQELWERKVREQKEFSLGFPRCATIHGDGYAKCQNCKHFVPHVASNKSPLHLARIFRHEGEAEPSTAMGNAPLVPSSISAIGGTIAPIETKDLPDKKYVVDKHGQLLVEYQKPARGDDPPSTEYKLLFYNRFYAPYITKDPWALNFISSTDAGGHQQGYLEISKFVSEGGAGLLAGCGCAFEPKNILEVRSFIMAWYNMLRKAAAARVFRPMGWQRDDKTKALTGFAYGGAIYHTDGTISSAGAIDNQLNSVFSPKGDPKHWHESWKMIRGMQKPGLEALVAAGFASPLMTFAGNIYNGFLSVYGQSGSGKSTAAKLGMGVWCSPLLAGENEQSTVKSVFNKMGKTQNLPFLWDEIISEDVMKKMYHVLFGSTLGAEGSRLFKDITLQKREHWQQMSMTCSNDSFGDYIERHSPSHKAGLVRILEWEMNKIRPGDTGHIQGLDASRQHGYLDYHFGHMGELYAPILARNAQFFDDAVRREANWFYNQLNLEGDERFWGAMAACLMVGAKAANANFALGFNEGALLDFLVATIQANRARKSDKVMVSGSKEHGEALLIDFLKSPAIFPSILRTQKNGAIINIVSSPERGKPVHVHFELSPDNRVMVSCTQLKMYCGLASVNQSYSALGRSLKKNIGARYDKLTIGKGTQWTMGNEYVYVIDIPPGSPLYAAMMAFGGETKAA